METFPFDPYDCVCTSAELSPVELYRLSHATLHLDRLLLPHWLAEIQKQRIFITV